MLEFVSARTGADPKVMRPAATLPVLRGETIVVGFVFNHYRILTEGSSVEVSMASDDPKAVTRGVLRKAFEYPFVQLGVARLEAKTSAANARCRKLLAGLGFTEEGTLRRAWDGKIDAVWFSMLPDECRWLR